MRGWGTDPHLRVGALKEWPKTPACLESVHFLVDLVEFWLIVQGYTCLVKLRLSMSVLRGFGLDCFASLLSMSKMYFMPPISTMPTCSSGDGDFRCSDISIFTSVYIVIV